MSPLLLSLILGIVAGLILALTGAGGGILAVPLLVCDAHLSLPKAAPIVLGCEATGQALLIDRVMPIWECV